MVWSEVEPKAKFSSSTVGAKKYGGWSDEGKKRFRKLEKWIKYARSQDFAAVIEEQTRQAIVEDLADGKKKKKKKVVDKEEAVLEEEESDSDEEPNLEGYDSEAEEKRVRSKKCVKAKSAEELAAEKAAEAGEKADLEGDLGSGGEGGAEMEEEKLEDEEAANTSKTTANTSNATANTSNANKKSQNKKQAAQRNTRSSKSKNKDQGDEEPPAPHAV